MNWTYLIPLAVGIAGILQGGVNEKISKDIGLAHGLMVGNTFVLILSILLIILTIKYPHIFPEYFKLKASFSTFRPWYLLPGLFGFIIITGIPMSIVKIGAIKTTVLIVVAQMITSIIWDLSVEKLPLNFMKSLGLFFSVIAVACTLYS